jgi:tetratricopeptide (TPR) repeat protein
MEPTKEQWEQLHQALMSAFPDPDVLERMIRFKLGENLSEIAGGNDLGAITYNLLKWAVSHGRLEELIKGAREFNSGNPRLEEIANQLLAEQKTEEYILQHTTSGNPPSQAVLNIEINQAQTLAAEGHHQQAAETFTRVSVLSLQRYAFSQASHYAVRAAEQFLHSNNQMSAAEQYLQSAEFWLESTFSVQPAFDALEKAQELIAQLDAPELQARILFALSRATFANLDGAKTMEHLEQASEIAITRLPPSEQRSLLLCDLAVWHSSQAIVLGEWDDAWSVLAGAMNAVPDAPLHKRIHISQLMLRISTQHSKWQLADWVYEEGQKLLDTPDVQRERGIVMGDYAASLARRGDLHEALELYRAAIEELENVDDPYVLNLAYQNMFHMLNQNGMFFISGVDDRRRIDLFNSTQIENKGFSHQRRAAENIGSQRYHEALQNIRLALLYYWYDGNWSGIQEVYHLLVKLHIETGDLVNAFRASLYTGDMKVVEHHSEKLLRTINDKQVFYNIVQSLTTLNAAASEQKVSAKALAILADVVPPDLLGAVVGYLCALLQIPEDNDVRVKVREHAAEALGKVVVQIERGQVNEVIRLVLKQLERNQQWTVATELLNVLSTCFIKRWDSIEAELYTQVYERVSTLEGNGPLPDKVRAVLVNLAHHADDDMRTRVVDYVSHTTSEIERIRTLAFLEEPVPEDLIADVVQRILQSANVNPIRAEDGSEVIQFDIGAHRLLSLKLFAHLLPLDLQNNIIDSLLEAIINDHNYVFLRIEAIQTLGELPDEILIARAEEIIEYLLWGAKGDLPRSPALHWIEQLRNPFRNFRIDMGSITEVQAGSLQTLGRLYQHVSAEKQAEIAAMFFSASRDKENTVRQGVGMALRAIESDEPLPTRLLLSLVGLMHDVDHIARGWACAACGHLIAKGSAGVLASELLEYLIDSANAQETEVRVGAAIGLATIMNSEQINEEQRERISRALDVLSDDVSFRVRREAVRYT